MRRSDPGYMRWWRSKNKRHTRDYRERNGERIHGYRISRYGLTSADYQRLLAAQGGKCAICHERPPARHRLVVDHCHQSGKRRALLCHQCNRLLGHAGDDPSRLRAAAAYLVAHA